MPGCATVRLCDSVVKMVKIVWLLLLAIPPWAAVEFDAPKWAVMIAAAPFFLYAMTLGDPDEESLGEASGGFRRGTLVLMAAGGLVLGGVLLILWQVLFPGA
jgi:hypothetical protein